MKETGILFKPEMIHAILGNKKTQSRRLIKPQCIEAQSFFTVKNTGEIKFMYTPLAGVGVAASKWIKCPFGRKGDLLYVKEGWKPTRDHTGLSNETYIRYRCDDSRIAIKHELGGSSSDKWKSPLFMFKKYARLWLELTADPIPQRLQEITETDAIAEGCPTINTAPSDWFADYIDKINGPGTWEINPWVWKLEFKRIER